MTLIDPTGGAGYGFGNLLPSEDLSIIATQQTHAVDGYLGGNYSPASPITISGDVNFDTGQTTAEGLEVTAALDLPQFSVTSIDGYVKMGSSSEEYFAQSSQEVFTNGATLLMQSGSVLSVNAGTTVVVGAQVDFNGTVNINGAVNIGDNPADALVIQSTSTIYSPVTFVDSIDIQAPIQSSSLGRVIPRVKVGTNGNNHYDISDGDIIFLPASILSTDRTYTIDATGAANGDRIKVITADSTYFLSVSNGIFSFSLKDTTTNPFSCELFFYSGAWHKSALSVNP